jgi:hypothetical protein
MLFGRDAAPGGDRPGAQAVATLSHAIWKSRYGSDRAVLERTINVNEIPTTIVELMPEGMEFALSRGLWTTIAGVREIGGFLPARGTAFESPPRV